MEKEKYLLLKQSRLMQASEEEKKRQNRCYQCHRTEKYCFCSFISPATFSSDIHMIILMHPMEARKEKTGTGRLAHLCLPDSSEIIVGLDFSQDPRFLYWTQNPEHEVYVLYPGEKSLNISENPLPYTFPDQTQNQKQTQKKKALILIDATWPCARKMMKVNSLLQELPRISFNVPEVSQFSIKHQPHEACLSTIEAIGHFLKECQRQGRENFHGKEEILWQTLARLVQIQKDCASQASPESARRMKRNKNSKTETTLERSSGKPYKDPSQRVKAKKWEKRNLFYV